MKIHYAVEDIPPRSVTIRTTAAKPANHVQPYVGGPTASQLAVEREGRKRDAELIYATMNPPRPLPPTINYVIYGGARPDPTVEDRLINAIIRLNRLEQRQEIGARDATRARKLLMQADKRRLKRDLPSAAESVSQAENVLDKVEASA